LIEIPQYIRALIFDCDGTLVDTMPIHLDAWKKAFEMNDRDFPFDFIESLKGASAVNIMELYNEQYNDNIDISKVISDKSNITRKIIIKAKPILPIAEIVQKYKNILPMSVVSGGSLFNVETSLSAAGLIEYFDIVITSFDKLPAKPEPDMFLEAARRMNVKPELCLVFEDGDFGLEAAKRAGMTSIDVRKYL
jgi:beta-phosphoglucomutase-like phosphatase (HAD superfamily)